MTAEVVCRWVEDGTARVGGCDDLQASRGKGCVWVDVTDPDEDALQRLASVFGLHPLAIEDCLHFPQRPKLDTYESGPFMIWLVPESSPDGRFDRAEIDIFLGRDFLITSHRGKVDVIDEVASGDPAEVLRRGPEWALHALLDRAVDKVFPLLDRASDILDRLEDELLASPDQEALQRLYMVKRRLIAAHKTVGPERDVIRALARQQAYVSEEAYLYFQDIGDHLARVEDTVDTYRDVASGVMDIYLSSVSNRLNTIMKRLTIVATVFMPGTLIAGIYGMNFHFMPELGWRFGYLFVLALMVAVTGGMLIWFKRSDWW